MKSEKINFCPETKFQSKLFELIKNDVIDLSIEEIGNLYKQWIKNFGEANAPTFESNTVFKKTAIQGDRIKQNLPTKTAPYLLGTDFPVWFNTPEKRIKIMILGLDPLRNEDVFNGFNKDENVLIGTPFALHSEKMRASETKQYWDFISRLYNDGHFLYITDNYKVFFYESKLKYDGNKKVDKKEKDAERIKARSYNFYKRKENKTEFHKELLNKEILEFIKPDLIITLGRDSYWPLKPREPKKAPQLTKLSLEKNKFKYSISDVFENNISMNFFTVLPMVHLSGNDRQKNRLKFLHANGITNIGEKFTAYGEKYYELIRNYLKNNPI